MVEIVSFRSGRPVRYKSVSDLLDSWRAQEKKTRKPRKVGAQLSERQRAALERAKEQHGVRFSEAVRMGLAALGIK